MCKAEGRLLLHGPLCSSWHWEGSLCLQNVCYCSSNDMAQHPRRLICGNCTIRNSNLAHTHTHTHTQIVVMVMCWCRAVGKKMFRQTKEPEEEKKSGGGGADLGPCSPDAPRPYEQAFCAPLLVSPVISSGAPRPGTWEVSISEGEKYGREMADPILPTACDFYRKCRALLHAANLRHGTGGFTSPPKKGLLRIFSPEKSDGFSRVWTRELGYQRPAC
jgi:hypothetical protein